MEAFLIQLAVNLVVSYYVWLLTAPDGPRLQGRDAVQADFGATLSQTHGEEASVGGKLLWLGSLRETKHDQKGLLPDWATGLAGYLIPKPKYYTYSRSFAVHVSDRLRDDPIEDITKIWFNGRLVFDATYAAEWLADGKTIEEEFDSNGHLKFRKWTDRDGAAWKSVTIYGGGFEQDPDPVIGGQVSDLQAYRGSAYVVVEDLQLAVYGNTFPQQMRFLVKSKTGETVADIANAIAAAAGLDPTKDISTSAACKAVVRGYAIDQETSCWDALAPLLPAYGFDIAEVGGQLRVYERTGSPRATIPQADMAAHEFGDERPDAYVADRAPDVGLPRELTLTTLDPARDYQPNSYTSRRSEGDAQSNISRQIAIVQTADERAKLAEMLHWEAWLGRKNFAIAVTDKWNPTPGVCYAVDAGEGLTVARVTRKTRGANGVIQLEMKSDESVLYSPTATGTVGDYTPTPLDVYGDTIVVPIDGPIAADADDNTGFYFAISGEEPTWTRGHVQFSRDNVTWSDVLDSDGDTIIADVTGTLDDGPWESGYDDDTVLTIVVPYDTLTLDDATDTELAAGANLCAVGSPDDGIWEYLQFGTATRIAEATWELTHLLRGRRGTDWATGLHVSGETFVLFSATGTYRLDPGIAYWNTPLYLRAWSATQTEADAVTVTFENTGEGKRPYSPITPTQSWAGGDLTIGWTRRSRFDDGSLGTDAPESYEVDILDGLTVVRTLPSSTPSVLYSAADMATDGVSASHVEGDIYQLNPDRGRGHPRHFLFSTTSGAGLAAGSSDVSGGGAATAEGAGAGAGTSTASGDSSGSGAGTAGSAAGTSTVSGAGGAIVAGAGSSSGSATASGEGSTGGGGAGTTAQKWRIRSIVNNDPTYFGCNEFMFLANPGDTSQPGAGTPSSSATAAGSAAGAFDGNTGTDFATAVSGGAGYLEFDFSSAQTIREVYYLPRAFVSQSPRHMVVEYWDGAAWQTAADIPGIPTFVGGVAQRFAVPYPGDEVGGHRYWRFNVTGTYGGSPPTAVEIEFLQSGSPISTQWDAVIQSSGVAGTATAFNGVVTGDAFVNFNATGRYAGVDFGRKRVVDGLRLTARGSSSFANQLPKAGTLDYSDDGVTWTTLFTINDAGASPTANEQRTYP